MIKKTLDEGDILEITDKKTHHQFNIGDEVVFIKQRGKNNIHYECSNKSFSVRWYLEESEFKLIKKYYE